MGTVFENNRILSTLNDLIHFTRITILPRNAFANCSGLVNVKIFDGVMEIGSLCFRQSGLLNKEKHLIMIDYPSTVQSFGTEVHQYCSTLQVIIVRAVNPPSTTDSMFKYGTIPTIYVPDESVNQYKSASHWSTWSNKIKPISEYAG